MFTCKPQLTYYVWMTWIAWMTSFKSKYSLINQNFAKLGKNSQKILENFIEVSFFTKLTKI